MRVSARSATFATAAALMLGVFAAPFFGRYSPLLGLWLRWFFAAVCHQRPERSFVVWGAPLAVCARCTGIYAGAVLGSLLRLRRQTALFIGGAALTVNAIDVGSEMIGLHGNLPWLRLAWGMAIGVGAAALLANDDSLGEGRLDRQLNWTDFPSSLRRQIRSALR